MASNRFTELLNEFDALPPCPGRLPTIMEIAGYPHYENVCSNMLKFFFDPGEPHGLGTLLLDVLPRVGGHQIPEGAFGSDVSVEREVVTHAGNRIDLLIRSDSYDILIENKIFAATANPFDDYSMYLRSLQPVDRQKLKFLLTLTRTNEGKEHGFQNITHGELVKGIRAQLGKYVAHADTRYLTFFLDFLKTLDHLQVGTLMSNGFLNLVSQRTRDVEASLSAATSRDSL